MTETVIVAYLVGESVCLTSRDCHIELVPWQDTDISHSVRDTGQFVIELEENVWRMDMLVIVTVTASLFDSLGKVTSPSMLASPPIGKAAPRKSTLEPSQSPLPAWNYLSSLKNSPYRQRISHGGYDVNIFWTQIADIIALKTILQSWDRFLQYEDLASLWDKQTTCYC